MQEMTQSDNLYVNENIDKKQPAQQKHQKQQQRLAAPSSSSSFRPRLNPPNISRSKLKSGRVGNRFHPTNNTSSTNSSYQNKSNSSSYPNKQQSHHRSHHAHPSHNNRPPSSSSSSYTSNKSSTKLNGISLSFPSKRNENSQKSLKSGHNGLVQMTNSSTRPRTASHPYPKMKNGINFTSSREKVNSDADILDQLTNLDSSNFFVTQQD